MITPTKIGELSRYEQEVGGWLAPDGTFYQADYSYHNMVAERVVDSMPHTEHVYYHSEWLVERGWIRLETDGYINHSFRPTTEQANILYHLYVRAEQGYYKRALYDHIAVTVLEVAHAKEPMPRVPGQGDQENFHWRVYA